MHLIVLLFIGIFLSFSSAHLVFDLSHDFGNQTINWPGATKSKVIPATSGKYDCY